MLSFALPFQCLLFQSMADFNFWARVARGAVVFRLWSVKAVPWVLEVPLTKVPPSFTPSLGTQSNVGHESRLQSSTASRCSETQCGPHTASWVRVAKGDSLPPAAVG